MSETNSMSEVDKFTWSDPSDIVWGDNQDQPTDWLANLNKRIGNEIK